MSISLPSVFPPHSSVICCSFIPFYSISVFVDFRCIFYICTAKEMEMSTVANRSYCIWPQFCFSTSASPFAHPSHVCPSVPRFFSFCLLKLVHSGFIMSPKRSKTNAIEAFSIHSLCLSLISFPFARNVGDIIWRPRTVQCLIASLISVFVFFATVCLTSNFHFAFYCFVLVFHFPYIRVSSISYRF